MILLFPTGPVFPKSGQKRPGSVHPGSAGMARKAIYNVEPKDSRLCKKSEKLVCPPGIPASAVVFHYVYLQRTRPVSMGLRLKLVSLISKGTGTRQKGINVHHEGGYKATGQVEKRA